jgi:phosphate transport system permease protein
MRNPRLMKDRSAAIVMRLISLLPAAIIILMLLGLLWRSWPILAAKPLWQLLLSSSWRPLAGEFGFFAFIMGSLWVTAVAVAIAVPPCILTALFLSDYAHRRLRESMQPLIDLLAGIPSVVYGVWGVLVVVPFVKSFLAPLWGVASTGYSVLAAGIVLAIMIAPVIIHVATEVLRAVPLEVREASLVVGATKWQTVKYAVLRKAAPGIVAAVVLGVSRAIGETMAVLMVVGNVARAPGSVFDPGYPLPALIANNYGEMLSVPLYDSALLLAALVLLGGVLLFNIASKLILRRIEGSM